MGFNQNLKRELTYSGMVIRELAEKSGIKLHTINNYLSTKGQIPSVETGAKIARALGTTVELLVFGESNGSKIDTDLRAINSLSRQLTDPQKRVVHKIIKILIQENKA